MIDIKDKKHGYGRHMMEATHKYPRPGPHGIMFHHFHGNGHPRSQGSIGAEDLERILEFIGEDRILDPEEWLERLERERLRDGDLCLTFDDGLLSQFEVALPVLEKHGLRAFWFIYSGVFEGRLERLEIYRTFRNQFFESIDDFYQAFFERVFSSPAAPRAQSVLAPHAIQQFARRFPFYSLNDVKFRLIRDRALDRRDYEQLMDEMIRERELRLVDLAQGLWMNHEHLKCLTDSGHAVGMHSYSHPTTLGDLSADKQQWEYAENYRHIREVCGRNAVAMAHPANSYNSHTLEILRGLDIRCGFRSNMSPAKTGGQLNPTKLEMAREDHSNILRMLDHGVTRPLLSTSSSRAPSTEVKK